MPIPSRSLPKYYTPVSQKVLAMLGLSMALLFVQVPIQAQDMTRQSRRAAVRSLLTQASSLLAAAQAEETQKLFKSEYEIPLFAHTQALAGDYSHAVATTERIVSEVARAQALSWIASVYFQDKQFEKGKATFATALALANTIKAPEDRRNTLAQILSLQVDAGDSESVLVSLDTLAGLEDRAKSGIYQKIVEEETSKGDMAKAKQVAHRRNGPLRVQLLAIIALAQARRGDTAGAQETLAEVRTDPNAREVNGDIIEALTVLHEFAGAIRTTLQIPDSGTRDLNFYNIAYAQLQTGDCIGAMVTARKIEGRKTFVGIASSICMKQVAQGDLVEVRRTLAEIPDGEDRSSVLRAIVVAQAQGGDIVGAKKATRSLETSYDQATVLVQIAEIECKNGDQGAARKTLSESFALIQQVQPHNVATTTQAIILWINIAKNQMRVGDIAGASETLRRAKATALKPLLPSGEGEVECGSMPAIIAVAVAQVETGDMQGAFATATEPAGQDSPVEIWMAIAAVLANQGEFVEAYNAVERIAIPCFRVKVLTRIATKCINEGDTTHAQEALRRAATYANQEMYAPDNIVEDMLSELTTAYAQLGDIPEVLRTAALLKSPSKQLAVLCEAVKTVLKR